MVGKDDALKIDSVYKKVTLGYMGIVSCVFLIFSIFFWNEKLYPYNYLTTVYFVLHIVLFFIPLRLEYRSIKQLIPIYLVIISVSLYPIVLFIWQINQVTAFMWFLLFPIGTMVFFKTKTVVFWTVYILVEVISIFILADIIPYKMNTVFTVNQLYTMNLITVISCLTLISFFIYYLNRINQMEIEFLRPVEETKEIDTKRYNEIYYDILNYFESKKPYCNSDFTINQLADEMETNVTYISKAININRGMNFNLFVNTYRINMVKDMLSHGLQNKYTIKYIYLSSGFKHQSTFNKVFKLIEGVTPSEYIRKTSDSKVVFDDKDEDIGLASEYLLDRE